MKQIKKIVSIMLSLAMVFAMSATAFASETDPSPAAPLTTSVTHTYEIYQIFTGDYADGVLSNIKWGENGTGTKDEKVSDTILKELEKINSESASDTEKLAVINNYADLEGTPVANGHETTYSGLTPGYYLVKDQDESLNGTNETYTLYVVQVVNNTLEFTPKGDVPETDKKIVEGDNKVSTNEASIGDEVNYEITGTMPSNIADYKTYYYMFTDTLSKGLTYKENSIKVTVNDVDVTKYFCKGVGDYNETTGTTIEVGILDLKALSLLTNPAVGEITKDTKVVLTYTATLNENAVIAGEGNPNDVKLSYSNDPNNSGDGSTTPPENPNKPEPNHPTGETPKDEVVTYTTELAILKTNEEGAILQGAEFTITGNGVKVSLVTTETFESDENGAYWKLRNGSYTTIAPVTADDESNNEADYDLEAGKFTLVRTITTAQDPTKAVATIDADGRVTFTGLGAGTYTIEETKTPAGYNTIEPITFTVTFDATSKTFSADKVSLGVNNTLETTIVNKKGSLLPSTGGIGTTIFYIIGGILVVGAAILLITKKRMSSEA